MILTILKLTDSSRKEVYDWLKKFEKNFLKSCQTFNLIAFNGCQKIRSVTTQWEEEDACQA